MSQEVPGDRQPQDRRLTARRWSRSSAPPGRRARGRRRRPPRPGPSCRPPGTGGWGRRCRGSCGPARPASAGKREPRGTWLRLRLWLRGERQHRPRGARLSPARRRQLASLPSAAGPCAEGGETPRQPLAEAVASRRSPRAGGWVLEHKECYCFCHVSLKGRCKALYWCFRVEFACSCSRPFVKITCARPVFSLKSTPKERTLLANFDEENPQSKNNMYAQM